MTDTNNTAKTSRRWKRLELALLIGLLAALDKALAHRVRPVKMVLPYDKLGLAEAIRTRGRVNVEEYRDEGVYMEGFVKADDVYLYQPYLV